jgi:hypothetical protein
VNSHDLREGDVIFLRDRGPVTVRRVTQRHERTPVCNLTVQGLHTFAVGEMQILVHNNSGTSGQPPGGGGGLSPKDAARAKVGTMGLSPAQEAAVRARITKFGKVNSLTVEQLPNGDVVVKGTAKGKVFGHNEWTATIGPDGSTKSVVQQAFDDAGKLIHDDTKK